MNASIMTIFLIKNNFQLILKGFCSKTNYLHKTKIENKRNIQCNLLIFIDVMLGQNKKLYSF